MNLFYIFFNNSLNMIFIIILIGLLEPLLKKRFTAVCLYRIWLILLLGLLIPFRLELTNSLFSIRLPRISIENMEPDYPDTQESIELSEMVTEGNPSKVNNVNNNETVTYSTLPQNRLPGLLLFLGKNFNIIICGFWLLGMFFFLLRNIIRYSKFLRQLKRFLTPITEEQILSQLQHCQNEVHSYYKRYPNVKIPNIYYCSIITSPMAIGFFRPIILLPKLSYSKKDLRFLIMHELIHIYRKDSLNKLIRVLVLTMNWFNPFCYLLSRRIDYWCEISCDEVVLHKSSKSECMDYSKLLLRCSGSQSEYRLDLITNFYGGTYTMKNRIFSIMNRGKKHPGKMLLLLIAAIVVTTAFISIGNSPETCNASTITDKLNEFTATTGLGEDNTQAVISGTGAMSESSKVDKKSVNTTKTDVQTKDAQTLREDVAEFAAKQEDVPYIWGGNDLKTGVDCSGFVQAVYKEFDYDLPRTSLKQLDACKEVSLDNLLPGDLIFYANSNDEVCHVAIYIGEGKVIHAANLRVGVTIADINFRKPYSAGRVITDH